VPWHTYFIALSEQFELLSRKWTYTMKPQCSRHVQILTVEGSKFAFDSILHHLFCWRLVGVFLPWWFQEGIWAHSWAFV